MRAAHDALASIAARPDGAVVLRALSGREDAWIVGGAVRDALIGREPRELDVVVVGDPGPLIDALGGAVVKRHEQFGTVTVEVADALVDVVQARAETYSAPGALPDVRPGSLEEDLRRRDVGVNAIALNAAGELRAVDGGLEDLREGVLRVLHDASFRDDPTRVWRVARYASRLGFAVDPRTRELAGAADPATVSGHRHGDEVRLALGESEPLRAFGLVIDLNPAFLPRGFDVSPTRLRPALELLPEDGRVDLVTLAAATGGVDAAALLGWLADLEFPAGDRDLVAAGSRASSYTPLLNAVAPSEIARAANGVPLEIVALAGGPNARRWIDELRHVSLEIGGSDLLEAGIAAGPEVGRRLRQALDRKLDEGISGREAELAAAMA